MMPRYMRSCAGAAPCRSRARRRATPTRSASACAGHARSRPEATERSPACARRRAAAGSPSMPPARPGQERATRRPSTACGPSTAKPPRGCPRDRRVYAGELGPPCHRLLARALRDHAGGPRGMHVGLRHLPRRRHRVTWDVIDGGGQARRTRQPARRALRLRLEPVQGHAPAPSVPGAISAPNFPREAVAADRRRSAQGAVLPALPAAADRASVLRRAQEGEHRLDPAVLLGRLAQPELHEDLAHVPLDGLRAQEQGAADRLVGPALAIRATLRARAP